MTAALRALMTGVIDYAGMFPPANLSLEDAVAEYLAIRESPEAWMLGRFVVPIDRVPDLEHWQSELCRPDKQLRLAVVGPRSDDSDVFRADLLREIKRCDDFLASDDHGVDFVSMELAMPDDVVGRDVEGISDWLGELGEFCKKSNYKMMEAYVEVPAHANAKAARDAVIRHIQETSPTFPQIHFKYRTGGLAAEAFPSTAELAKLIQNLCAGRCPWKATAGLHHAVRQFDSELQVARHGFLNLMFADIFARFPNMKLSTIEEVLSDDVANSFRIDDQGIRWRDLEATADLIEVIRISGFQSFGSCSFDEPRDDLKQLGLL